MGTRYLSDTNTSALYLSTLRGCVPGRVGSLGHSDAVFGC